MTTVTDSSKTLGIGGRIHRCSWSYSGEQYQVIYETTIGKKILY